MVILLFLLASSNSQFNSNFRDSFKVKPMTWGQWPTFGIKKSRIFGDFKPKIDKKIRNMNSLLKDHMNVMNNYFTNNMFDQISRKFNLKVN